MSLAQGNNTPTRPRIELSKVYMLKTCLEIITEKERGMKLFSWIHMFLIGNWQVNLIGDNFPLGFK